MKSNENSRFTRKFIENFPSSACCLSFTSESVPSSVVTSNESNTFKMILHKTIDLWLSLDSVLPSLSLIRGTIVAMSKTAYMTVDQ